mmetsp:Transcript_16788/g.32717  ORF Transcript_16788/g.32717 Transcript_16788/m.32717 type:complete len:350 (+) Transcript_16788:144-1193(+)|eukprot:CAMPEP_0171513234 /NCGR_PEP_ID=MMETSP0959-20130129/2100_1 /TAXON_ID=87120 /ORGANISM="Aurantiochytrium limacinum, Strain ATCCMYA-1381" /LENGTH=349 /DNA_ID=CAMNT_0012051275 /DNA_START=120 /DNA_END=1169 /DNA_ORIENTATION=+
MWIFALEFAPDDRWLLSGTSAGELVCWDIDSAQTHLARQAGALSSVAAVSEAENDSEMVDEDDVEPAIKTRSFKAHNSCIYTLAQHREDQLLFTGADEEIRIWRAPWADDPTAHPSPVGEIRIPQIAGVRGALSPVAETNGLAILAKQNSVVAAAGDGNTYMFDIPSQKLLRKLAGQDMLHAVVTMERTGLIATGSEDGLCKLWDPRSSNQDGCVGTLDAGFNVVSALAASDDENWLAFGGSTRDQSQGAVSMVHVASRLVTKTTLSKTSSLVQNLQFADDHLLVAGDSPALEFWSRNMTDTSTSVPCSAPSLFGLSYNKATGMIAVGGSADHIDLFSDARDLLMSLAV